MSIFLPFFLYVFVSSLSNGSVPSIGIIKNNIPASVKPTANDTIKGISPYQIIPSDPIINVSDTIAHLVRVDA